MNRILASLSVVGLLAVGATAQCPALLPAPLAIGGGDDTFFTTHYPLGFAMPVAGSALGTYTHFRVCTNGWLILTNGTTTPAGTPAGNNYGSSASLAGTVAAYAPRVAPYWRDMTVTSPGAISYDNTTAAGVACTVEWRDTRDYNILPTKTYQVELNISGVISMSYSGGMNVNGFSAAFVGVSRGNGQAAVAASNLSAGPSSAGVGMVWESFATGAFDLGAKKVTYTPDGSGGWNVSVADNCAFHANYGTGCYTYAGPPTDAFHEFFATPALASAALQGNAMVLTPTVNGYTGTWVVGGATGYVAPGGGAVNLLAVAADDGSATITPSAALSTPFGAAATVTVETNGIVTPGSVAAGGGDFSPTSADFGADTLSAFYSWHDFNETESSTSPAYTSGRVKWEEVAGILYVTWDNVESYADPDNTQNPSTQQVQLDLATGVITIVWPLVDIDGSETTYPTGIPYVVGLGGVGATAPAPITLATGLPVTTTPIVTLSPLSLSASPAPTYTVGNPSVPITYTISNAIDNAPPFGIGINLLIASVVSIPGGIDLGPLGIDIGAGGCNLYIGSFDVILIPSGTAPISTLVLAVPQPLSPGLNFYFQAVSLFTPSSLPNGQNALGAVFSNGVQSSFNLQ